MTAPRLAQATDFGRMYARTRGAEPVVPSITTVLDEMNHRMEWWEALCSVRLAMEHAPALHDVHAMPRGPEKWDRERRAKDWLVEAAERDRDAAAQRGDLVHNYAEVYALTTIGRAGQPDLTERREECERAGLGDYLRSFHAFWDEFQPRVLAPEVTVWNSTVGYAGTTDLICEIDVHGRAVSTVLDYKTRRAVRNRDGSFKPSALQPYTGMQLAAAAHGEEAWIEGESPDQDRWEPFAHRIVLGLGVALGPDGYVVRQYRIDDPLMWTTFGALRQAWDFHRHGAALMGADVSGLDGLQLPEPPIARVA